MMLVSLRLRRSKTQDPMIVYADVNTLTLILGNQLFPEWLEKGPLALAANTEILMVEDLGIAKQYRYHRKRLLHTFVSMRTFRDQLLRQGHRVRYFELPESESRAFWDRVRDALREKSGIRVARNPDRSFMRALQDFCLEHKVPLEILPCPSFLSQDRHFDSHLDKNGKPFMKRFYEQERKRLNILVDSDQQPVGGQWSFDSENRKKLPKHYREPPIPEVAPSPHEARIRSLIEKYFPDHPGETGALYLPYDHEGARTWLSEFLKVRLEDFGPYEDALDGRRDFLHHSLLSPLLNLGILSPRTVVEQTLDSARKSGTPLASVEGFLRQIIGWREFVRGVDQKFGAVQESSNFWNHHRKLGASWYRGDTGIPPLDDAIKKVLRLGYNHHIERLMVISNLMLLSEIHPQEAHRWFMEMYVDSYEWVMGPNVYGMGLMSDGGIFATKPYISGSNYILKMSDYTKGTWCEEWDGLYWSFIDRHRGFFSKNPRLSMMVKLLEKMPASKIDTLRSAAARFRDRNSTAP
jgi:deoxyribodipyrimidine photolyase-related protein